MASSINASTSGAGGLITTADNTGILNIQTAGTTAVTVDANATTTLSSNSSQPPLIAKIGGTEKVRIDLSGQLLMGTTGGYDSNATGAITLNANAPDGTVNFKKGIVFSSDGGDNPFVWAHAGITSTGSSGFNGNLIFGTDGSGTQTSTITERMRIDSSGRLLLAGTSAIAGYQFTMYHTDTGGMAYKYNGTSEQNSCSFQNGNGQVGRIYTSGSNTTYSTSSDYRLKENVVPMTGALDKVAQLNPVTFTWKTDGTDGQGFIAHELQAVVPDCVGGTKDAVDADGNPVYQDIDTSFLVATLTAAIKEQQTIINNLKARIETLEAK